MLSYKEQSSGDGGSAEEGEAMAAEDYYYEEEHDDRPTVEKVRVSLTYRAAHDYYHGTGAATKDWKSWR